ncbi:tat pathway signal sequence [Stemphylium lycopersici]|nr:tat pathway signal sequence [Stemphylium lycopersici]RAR02540.1 tat pathway signal sequence [Stemphylium lycopersici]
MKDVGIHYEEVRFNGSLFLSNAYRMDAGPEVDAAWKSLGVDYHAARVPAKEAQRSGLALDQVKIKEEYGGGYPAHNLLRKSLSWNYDYYQKQGFGPFSNDANVLKHHVTHVYSGYRRPWSGLVPTSRLDFAGVC